MALVLDAIVLVLLSLSQPSEGSALTEAAASGNITELEHLLEAGTAVNEPNSDGEYALGLAVQNGHSSVFHLLVQNASGLDLNVQNREYGRSALMDAAVHHQPELGHELIMKGAALDLRGNNRWTGLIDGIALHNSKKYARDMQDAWSQDLRDASGLTALMLAVVHYQPQLVKELVEKGAAMDLQDANGMTALSLAALFRQPQLGKVLVEERAALDVQDQHGFTALMWASDAHKTKLALELLDHGADWHIRSSPFGLTTLHIGARRGNLELVEAVLDRGQHVDSRDVAGRTALWWASHENNEHVAKALVKHGANVVLPALWGQTPEKAAHDKELQRWLHEATPGLLGQARLVARSAETWTHLGLGLLVGIVVAVTAHFCKTGGAHRPTGYVEEDGDHAVKGAKKLAHQAFAKRNKLRFYAVLAHHDNVEIADLAMRISATRSADEIELLECDIPGVKVVPERRLSVSVTVVLALSDMLVTDYVTIFNLVMAYHTKFAGVLLAVTVMSTLTELMSGTFVWLRRDTLEAISRGVMPDRLVDFLAVEKGLEAPFSLAVTVYAFPFSVRGWFSLGSGLLSVALGVYGCAQYLAGFMDKEEAADVAE